MEPTKPVNDDEGRSRIPSSPEHELLSTAKWVNGAESPFGVDILDCRPVVLGLASFTADPAIASRFTELRSSLGAEFRGKRPKDARSVRCNLNYPRQSRFKEGPLSKAQVMEDRWDIYMYDGCLYFARSWSGDLIFLATISFGEQLAHIDEIETASSDEDEFVIRQVDFLIQNHIFGLEMPHPLPSGLGRDPQRLAVYSFQLYGRRGFWGAMSDAFHER